MADPTLFSLEAVNAEAGDCLLLHFGTKDDRHLVLIDGGPGRVYENDLCPRLLALRGEKAEKPLPLRLAMVSHIDDDHITGVRKLLEQQDADGDEAPAAAEMVWHNGIEDALPADLRASIPPKDELPTPQARAVVAGIDEGRRLGAAIHAVGLEGNPGFDEPPFTGLVMQQSARDEPVGFDALTLRVLLPDQERLDGLWGEWRRLLAEKARRDAKRKARIVAFADDSLTNLSSIVVLAECGGRTMLLTGDARGDHLEDAVRKAGLKYTVDKPLDVFKVPHHGSSRNIEVSTFKLLPARHYVFSADGAHENPDVETLEMLFQAREELGRDDFTLHFTNERMIYKDRKTKKVTDIGEAVRDYLDRQSDSRSFEVEYRAEKAHSLVIDLLEVKVKV